MTERYHPQCPPPEPPVGTWMKDRNGSTTLHQEYTAEGGIRYRGWGQPGTMPFGKWEAMWEARGPYVECGPWGAPLPDPDRKALLADPLVQKVAEAICPGSYDNMPTIWLLRAHRAVLAVREADRGH